MKERQYYSELTVMSGIAILFVLGIHGCGSALHAFYTGAASYVVADVWLRFLSNLVAPAVPMFVFVSGYKYALHDFGTPYFPFLKKRLPRVIMSFAIINTIFWIFDSIKYMESFDVILLLKTYLSSWVGYSVAYQLWYIPMYCFVMLLCPLVCRAVPSSKLRFCIYATVGIIQRALEINMPIFATYPIRFISYPVFFEMGFLAQEMNWQRKMAQWNTAFVAGIYVLLVAILSWTAPALSADGLTKYLVYYFAGTAIFFAVSVQWKNSRFLQWLGGISYPVFLLHEPLIGRCVGTILGKLVLPHSMIFAHLWVFLNFVITLSLIKILKSIKINQILWEYSCNSMLEVQHQ